MIPGPLPACDRDRIAGFLAGHDINVRAVAEGCVDALGLERIMFEAPDPEVFAWYIKSYGPEVNLFVDHSQIAQRECLRLGIWGTKGLWGRLVTYNG